ncbi:MAG: hypothetical protein H8E34_04980 [Bacteroidetes bacterium]|nr:hypothetical protein [Bacteroidota bacterium]MBL6944451.1 hypothetical protein [Bacteroidales bacterium]
MFALLMVSISSCKKDNNQDETDLTKDVIGTYEGTLTTNNSKTTSPAISEISSINKYTIQVHCYGDYIDTTFMLELYQDGNMMNVCFTDNDFYNEYGHNQSENHHMMGDNGNWTNWQNHMNNDHDQNDNHYGYFDINEHIFDYTFNINTPTCYQKLKAHNFR